MKEFYSTLDVSSICGVDPVTVARWCDRGDLNCYKTPGGHRRIRGADLEYFLRKHKMELPPELKRKAVRVLAMGGDARQLAAMKKRYANHGGQVELTTAPDCIEGLIQYGHLVPEFVVIDLECPGIDPLAICRQLVACPGNKAKLVAVGGSPAKQKLALRAGVDAVLPKPLDLKALDGVLLPHAAVATPAAKS